MTTQDPVKLGKRLRSQNEDDENDIRYKRRHELTKDEREGTIVLNPEPVLLLQPRNKNITQRRLLPSIGEFEIPESEIEIIDLIGIGSHAIVYRIAARHHTFALKVHKYDIEAISQPGAPKTNALFNNEIAIYSRLSFPKSLPMVPKCHGYLNLSKPPQVHKPSSIPRDLFKSKKYRPAVYTDFLIRREPGDTEQGYPEDVRWKDYFKNKSRGFVLRGLVLDEITTARPIGGEYGIALNSRIAQSGREGLEALHKRGIIHGDVKNAMNALVLPGGGVIWVDFSLGEDISNLSQRTFIKKAGREIGVWNHFFTNNIKGP